MKELEGEEEGEEGAEEGQGREDKLRFLQHMRIRYPKSNIRRSQHVQRKRHGLSDKS